MEIADILRGKTKEEKKLLMLAFNAGKKFGAESVMRIAKELSEIDPLIADEYGVWHEDSIDGG